MSRSYKKHPYVTDHSSGTKSMKRIANRTVRRRLKQDEDIPARLKHRKMTESWDICDYRWRTTREEAIQWYYETMNRNDYRSEYWKKYYPTLESYLNYWEKCHRRK